MILGYVDVGVLLPNGDTYVDIVFRHMVDFYFYADGWMPKHYIPAGEKLRFSGWTSTGENIIRYLVDKGYSI
jgi:hypothetical protein